MQCNSSLKGCSFELFHDSHALHYNYCYSCCAWRFAFFGASEETIPKHDEINALVKYRILSLNTYKHRSSIGISFIMSFQFSPSSKAQVWV